MKQIDLRDACSQWIEIIEDINSQTDLEETNKLLSVLIYSITSASRKINEPTTKEAA